MPGQRPTLLALVVLLAARVLTACGGSDAESPASGGAAEQAAGSGTAGVGASATDAGGVAATAGRAGGASDAGGAANSAGKANGGAAGSAPLMPAKGTPGVWENVTASEMDPALFTGNSGFGVGNIVTDPARPTDRSGAAR